jgi:hypothetical protein
LTEDKNKGTVRVSEVSVFLLMVERNRIFGGKRSCTYRRICDITWNFIRQIELGIFVLVETVIMDICSRRHRLLLVRLLLRNPALQFSKSSLHNRAQNFVSHSRDFFRRWLHCLAARISDYNFFVTIYPLIGNLGADGEDFSFVYYSSCKLAQLGISVDTY